MPKDLAIVLCSGSISSTVAATLAAQKHRVIAMTADSGHANNARRRAACDLFISGLKPVKELAVTLPFAGGAHHAGAADPRAAAELTARLADLAPLMTIALRFASQHTAGAIYTGLRVGPEPAPLSRATEFVQILAELAQHPLAQPDVELACPLLELEPWQVVDLGIQVGAPLEKTWSCHQDADEPCHACPGCRSRDAAFEQAARPDPLGKRA